MSPGTRQALLVIGGGPAGAAAACAARAAGLSVAVLERGATPQPDSCAGWLGPAAVRTCTCHGVTAAEAGAVEFHGLRLRSWDLKQCVDVHAPELSGWVVEPSRLSAALLAAARRAGAQVQTEAEVTALHPGEDAVSAEIRSGDIADGQIALLADGASSQTAAAAHLLPAQQIAGPGGGVLATWDVPSAEPGVEVLIGAGRALRVATIVRGAGQVRLYAHTRDTTAPVGTQLMMLVAAAQAAGVLPAEPPGLSRPGPLLGGTALELESHVGKRVLLIGSAGGFVAALSQEGIYPAMRSGQLAVETAVRALAAPLLQDELMSFGAAWRADLADYLRMPNTDLGLLMPLVFGNPQMSRRVARAFLLGQTF